MGGELSVESERGRGSRFFFTVELGMVDASGPPDQAPLRAPPRLRDLRALVVEDNPCARQIVTEMVNALGWYADSAASGEEALARVEQAVAKSRTYEGILVDWKMPGIDGWDTSKKIRQLQAGQAPLIVMVSAHGREMLAERATREGHVLDGFLTKPITASMLLDAVADARASHPPHIPDASVGKTAAATTISNARRLQDMIVLVVEDTT